MVRMMRWGLAVLGLAAVGVIGISAVGTGGGVSAQVAPEDDVSKDVHKGDRFRELLSDELGITVEELTDAQTAARDKLIDEALAAGDITAEQAERFKSMEFGEGHPGFRAGWQSANKLHRYAVGVFETAADLVGIPADELRERIADGESLLDIADSQGISEDTLKADLVAALTEKINQAVDDGDLNEDLAARLLENLESLVDRAINADRPLGEFGRFHMERFMNR